jgi:hypothetical protein
MMLIPYVGDLPIDAGNLKIVTDAQDQKRLDFLVARAQQIKVVDDQDSMTVARRIGSQIKALEDEIAAAKKAAKTPHRLIENAIEDRSKEISAPLLHEKKRVAGLLGAYVLRLEEIEKAEQLKREAALQAQVAEQQRRLHEAEEAKRKAEQEARAAKDEAEKIRARQRVEANLAIAAQAQLATEMAQEAARIGTDKPPKGKIPGGRVTHHYDYKIVDLLAVIKGGHLRCLRWEIDKLACNDIVRAQLEDDPEAIPKIPGIEITRTINVNLKPAARIQ